MQTSNPPTLPPRPREINPQPPPLPPRLLPFQSVISEKLPGFQQKERSRKCYPGSRRGKLWFWNLLLALLIILAIVIAVLAKTLLPDHAAAAGDGGHPLPISRGGVKIGRPGDIPRFGEGSTDHFVLQINRSSVVTRLDPIVSPGGVGSHVHRFHGSSYITQNRINATEMQSLAKCSTVQVQDDKSAYWVAQLYYRYPNGSFQLVPIDYHAVYYFQKAPTGVPIYPFPDNYNLVAGNPYRRVADESRVAEQAVWQCFRGNGNDTRNNGFPDTQCVGGLDAIVTFPSCWDGTTAADGNYTGHVDYPLDGPNGWYCPRQFPRKFITVQFETTFSVNQLPFNGPDKVTWVLANGDASGYGIHADFMNGWKPETLQSVVDNCRYMNKTDAQPAPTDPRNCPALEKTNDFGAAWNCHFQSSIVDEIVGGSTLLSALPGCNALWQGNIQKPGCPPGQIEGGELKLTTPSQWQWDEPYVA